MTEIARRYGATSSPAAAARSGAGAAAVGSRNGGAGVVVSPAETGAGVVVDVGGAGDDGSDRDGEEVCRICQLGARSCEEGSELILLGCGCKGELGVAHRHCSEAWFKVKGNRCCEICGENAKNITVHVDIRAMEEGQDGRELNNQNSSENIENIPCWRRLPFCNLLMACLIIAFILLWFFRISMF